MYQQFVHFLFMNLMHKQRISLKQSVSPSSIALAQRITHLVCGIVLLIPLINAIVLTIFKFLNSKEPLKNSVVLFNHTQESHRRIQELTEQGKFDEAWDLYVKITNVSQIDDENGIFFPRSGATLPPVDLISNIVGKLQTREEISAKIPVELLRDCASAYDGFFQKCLSERKIWDCFIGFQECIADIGKQKPVCAFDIITSISGTALSTDKYRFEIFSAAYPQILANLQNGSISDEQIKYLGAYLLRYREVVLHEDFGKIKIVADAVKKRENCDPDLMKLVEFVVAKLSLQGIYKKGENLLQCFDAEHLNEFFRISHADSDQNEIAQKFVYLNLDEHVEIGFHYLSLIPKGAPNYAYANMLLGNLWMENDEPIEAGIHFLKAIHNEEVKEEALFLAAANLLVRVNTPNAQANYVARREQSAFLPLNIEDCRAFAANRELFFNTLREQYPDHQELLSLL